MLSDSSGGALDHGSTRHGRWLQERRIRIAAWIAAAEGLIVLLSPGITKWTVIVIAAVACLAWYAGRESSSHTLRQVLWIFAASQLAATILVILAWVLKWAVVTGIVILAVGGLVYLLRERR